jgi:hypothetical protein
MDPVTIVIIIILFVLGGGGAGASAVAKRRRERRLEIKDAIRERTQVGDNLEVSIFDVFWDLGVNEYALEIMGNQRLLIRGIEDLPTALDNLRDAVEVHGSYSAFIRETLETIEEFYRGHKTAGSRRQLPALEVRETRTLELPAIDADDRPDTGQLPVPYAGSHLPVAARSFSERVSARSGGQLSPLVTTFGGAEVDIDELTQVDPMRVLKSIFDGNIETEINRFFKMWNLRDLRKDLDRELSRFYSFYVDQVAMDPRFYGHLYDTARRWDLEIRRVEELIERKRWKGKEWEICGEVLLKEALAVTRQLAWLARNNVDQTIEKIHDHARRGDTAMAGYLVYLNHQAFFAGRGGEYPDLVRRVENTTYRLQEELRELRKKGVV